MHKANTVILLVTKVSDLDQESQAILFYIHNFNLPDTGVHNMANTDISEFENNTLADMETVTMATEEENKSTSTSRTAKCELASIFLKLTQGGIVLGLMILVASSFVLIVYLTNKKTRKTVNSLWISLLLADILIGSVSVPINSFVPQWKLFLSEGMARWVCVLMQLWPYCMHYIHTYTYVIVSIDRYMALH